MLRFVLAAVRVLCAGFAAMLADEPGKSAEATLTRDFYLVA
jgi:hypothetical protein